MRRKTTAFLALLALLFLLTACGGGNGSSKPFVAGTTWTGSDQSYLIFGEDDSFAWYKDKDVTDDNYYKGTYEFYRGEEAMTYLTEDLSEYGVTKEEMEGVIDRADEYELEDLVCWTFHYTEIKIDGQDYSDKMDETSYYGFVLYDDSYLDIANMSTATYYSFTKN